MMDFERACAAKEIWPGKCQCNLIGSRLGFGGGAEEASEQSLTVDEVAELPQKFQPLNCYEWRFRQAP